MKPETDKKKLAELILFKLYGSNFKIVKRDLLHFASNTPFVNLVE